MATSHEPAPGTILHGHEFWRSEEYAPLVNYQQLKRVAQEDPWQVDVTSRLKNFLFRMEAKNIVNFRVSGIVVHSASMLCKAKSRTMVNDGSEMQDALAVDQDEDLEEPILDFDGNGYGDLASMDEQDNQDERAARALASGAVDVDGMLDMIAGGRGSLSRVLSKQRLERFNVPKRVVARPLTVADLSVALNDAIAGKFRRKQARTSPRDIVLPQAIKESYNDELKVERLVESVDQKVRDAFEQGGEPVSFISLFEHLNNTLLVVKTFLAVLHMINKKIVEAWQVPDGTIQLVPFGHGDTFATRPAVVE